MTEVKEKAIPTNNIRVWEAEFTDTDKTVGKPSNTSCTVHDACTIERKVSRQGHRTIVTVKITQSTVNSDVVFRLLKACKNPMTRALYFETLPKSKPTKEASESNCAFRYVQDALWALHDQSAGAKEKGRQARPYKPPVTLLRSWKINDIMNDPNVLCIIPGDGQTPRTGFLFAMATLWQVHSIDPEMKDEWVTRDEKNTMFSNGMPPNLMCTKSKLEDFKVDRVAEKKPSLVVLVHVHSHCNFEYSWERFVGLGAPVIGFTMLCCKGIRQDLTNRESDVDTRDWQVHSECNRVRMYMHGF